MKDKYLEYLEKTLHNPQQGFIFVAGRCRNIIHLYEIEIPIIYRGTGIGSSMMNQLIEYADGNNCIITLRPATLYGEEHYQRLVRWYQKFGFVVNADDNSNNDIAEIMYRLPKKGD